MSDMARSLRIEYPGAVYHIISRGNARQEIFLDEKDHIDFLDILCMTVRRYKWILHAYCLMNNHYHLLIETPDGVLSRGMRQLNGVYTQRFNARHKRVGHVLQGRYKAILVDKDSYLLELCRYIVLNPVRAGIVKEPGMWGWSSYRATAGYEKGIHCLTTDWILIQFDNEKVKAEIMYRDFVQNGLKEEPVWKGLKGQIYLVDDVEHGYTLKEIAEYLGVHYTTVSRTIKRIERREEK